MTKKVSLKKNYFLINFSIIINIFFKIIFLILQTLYSKKIRITTKLFVFDTLW